MANLDNKNGRWITTKDGRKIFISEDKDAKNMTGALSKRRAEKRANAILAKYPLTDNRKADDIDAKGLRDALQKFYEENNGSAVGHTLEDKEGALYIDGKMVHQFDVSDTLNRRIGRTAPKEGEPDYEAKQLDKQDSEAEPPRDATKTDEPAPDFDTSNPPKHKQETAFNFDTTKWKGSLSANDMMIDYLKRNNIPFFFTKYFQLVADVDGTGEYYPLDHVGNGEVVVDKARVYKK